MVTAGTYGKEPFFRSSGLLGFLRDTLIDPGHRYAWQLQAWAVFPNHYHFVALSPANAETLRVFIRHLHSATAREVNHRDRTPGRKVWFEYWDTRLTYERSYFARLNYVHQNAVRHGLVRVASAYPWCSAAWFERKADRAFYKRIVQTPCDRITVQDEFVVDAGGLALD